MTTQVFTFTSVFLLDSSKRRFKYNVRQELVTILNS